MLIFETFDNESSFIFGLLQIGYIFVSKDPFVGMRLPSSSHVWLWWIKSISDCMACSFWHGYSFFKRAWFIVVDRTLLSFELVWISWVPMSSVRILPSSLLVDRYFLNHLQDSFLWLDPVVGVLPFFRIDWWIGYCWHKRLTPSNLYPSVNLSKELGLSI